MNEQEKAELINYRINRAEESLKEVQLLIENKLWTFSINRIYYSCYYAVSALMLKHNIETKTHSGIRQMFGLHFVKTSKIPMDLGKFYSDIFEMRQSGDYDDYIEFTEEEVQDALKSAEELILNIKSIL